MSYGSSVGRGSHGPGRALALVLGALGLPILLAGACDGSAFLCETNTDCGDYGVCEPGNVCSFSDPSCPSGRRYGQYSGIHAGECTPFEAPAAEPEPPPVPPSDDDPGLGTSGDSGDSGDSGGNPDEVDGSSTTAASPTTAGVSATADPGPAGSSDTGPGSGAGETSTTGAATPSCEELYGEAPGFLLCEESSQACTFYAQTNGTCDVLCGDLGGGCITAFRDSDSGCGVIEESDCFDSRVDQICRCTR